MKSEAPANVQDMKQKTVSQLQELVAALNDSWECLAVAGVQLDGDDYARNTLRSVAEEHKQIRENIAGFIELTDQQAEEDGTFLGKMRTIWTAFRAGLNAGDSTVILIEAEKAEDAIKHKFEEILPQIAGNPVNDRLNEYYKVIKDGHDRVLALRNAYQAKT